MRVTHVSMAVNANPQFYQFWPYLKRHYKENLGITPLLTYVGPVSYTHLTLPTKRIV